ncbi:glucanase B [Stagonosporopsis vannaccii]|nr:glucanase B [Stagonosporopsis vannaccii]
MPDSLQIALKNDSDSENIHAYVTGIAIKHDGKRCLLKANGKDLYFPTEVKDIGSSLQEDCAIPLGKPGNTTNITIPQIAGGRIWIVDGKLTFLLNPGGPALVEPSVLNPSDPNHGVNFGFAEFTLNDAQLYANISYVDFVPRIPIAIRLQQHSGASQHVAGMRPDGLDQLADSLRAQAQKDGRPWDKLIVHENGQNLRILNATHGNAVGADFSGYFEPLVDEAWNKYSACSCHINTQAGPGELDGHITSSGKLRIGDEEFDKPSTADILGCNSGPFTTGSSPARNAIIPRLAAAFVRSSITETQRHPSPPETFYTREPTNHYARLVHEVNVDGKGYAFAYDDVQPDDGDDQSGKVNAGDPKLFVVSVGGKSAGGASTSAPVPQQQQQQQPRQEEEQQEQPQTETQPPPADAPPAAKQGFRDRMFAQAKTKAKGFLSR